MAKMIRAAAAVANIAAVLFPGPVTAIAAVALNIAALAVPVKPPGLGGTQTQFKSDPRAPIPIVVGRTMTGGNIVYWKSHGAKNKYLSLVSVLSLTCASIDATLIDKEVQAFSGHAATGSKLEGLLWQDTQLGLCPEPGILTPGEGTPVGWTSNHKLSGLAAAMWTLLYDGKGKTTLTQVPKGGWLIHGVLCYDPRLDSTYPGGSGPQRANDQTTWAWSENPFVVGLTFAIGWRQNGIRVGGVGMGISSIDLSAFVEGANVCDANGWTCGGSFTTGDEKWGVLKAILQAGGGEPIRMGATLSCLVNTPRVPIATITDDDIIGRCSIPMAKTRRERFNGVIPTYRSEDHDWEVVPAGVVRNATYLAQDGTERTREIAYSMVQCVAGETPDQVAKLAGYDIANAREAEPITLGLKTKWIGYRAGDCLECSSAETGLAGRQLIVKNRMLAPDTAAVTLTVRTENPDKHAEVLALVGVPAPTTDRNTAPDAAAPDAANWTLAGTTVSSAGGSVPALVVEGNAGDDSNATSIIFSVRPYDAGNGPDDGWQAIGVEPAGISRKVITEGIAPNADYEVSLQYLRSDQIFSVSDRLILGPETAGDLEAGAAATAATATTAGSAGTATQLGGTYEAADITDILDRLAAAGI